MQLTTQFICAIKEPNDLWSRLFSPYIIASPVSCRNLKRRCLNNHMVKIVRVRSRIKTSRSTLSCLWLSSAFFSVTMFSIALSSALHRHKQRELAKTNRDSLLQILIARRWSYCRAHVGISFRWKGYKKMNALYSGALADTTIGCCRLFLIPNDAPPTARDVTWPSEQRVRAAHNERALRITVDVFIYSASSLSNIGIYIN